MKLRAVLAVLALVTTPSVAAAEPSATQAAIAQSLFDEARTLLDAGRYDEACAKLTVSQRLDPGGGTLLNLALCHERQGRLATAWTEYTDAMVIARRDGREDRISFARDHLAEIEPRLPHVRIFAPPSVTTRLDDVEMEGAVSGVALPVDPGRHLVRASATGKQPWTTELVVQPGENIDVRVPELAPAAAAEARRPETSSTRRWIGWGAIGVGGAAVIAGAVAGALALDHNAKSNDLCPSDPCQNPEGVRASQQATTEAWIANGAIAGGLIAAGVGTYLVLTSKRSTASPPPVSTSGLLFRF